MIVVVEGFGSIWSVRNGPTRDRTAFYNTTGLVVNGRPRHRSRVLGQIRFNAIGGFNPQNIESNIGRVFESAELPKVDGGCLLLHHALNRPEPPDFYLFAVRSERTGVLRVDETGLKSEGVALLSLSEFRQQQEAMLLMPAHSWIRGGLGRFVCEPFEDRPWRATLQLKGY